MPGGRAAVEEAGWSPKFYWASETKPPVVSQALALYGELPEDAYCGYPFTAKNLLISAWIPDNKVSLETVNGRKEIYPLNTVSLGRLQQLFWTDINGLQETTFQMAGDYAAVTIGQKYYQTAVELDGQTYVDGVLTYRLSCQLLKPEAFVPGEPIEVRVEGPFAGMSAAVSMTLDELTAETKWVLNGGPYWSVAEALNTEAACYRVTVRGSAFQETLILKETGLLAAEPYRQ